MSGYGEFGLSQLLVILAFVGGCIAVFLALVLTAQHRSRKRIIERIRREWGTLPERQYDPAEFDNISHYYLNRQTEEFQLDDITWNDLDMDRIFMQLNHTQSFIGESCLYYRLRTPRMQNQELAEFERQVEWFRSHEKEREETEYFFAKIGRTGRTSIFDYIYNLADAVVPSNLIHLAMICLILGTVAVLLINPQPGILLLIAAIGISIGTYEHYKRPIAPYISSCASLEKVLRAAEQICKYELYGLKKEEIRKAISSFARLRRNMMMLVIGDAQGGGLEQVLVAYLNNLFHIDLIQFKTVVHEIDRHLPEFEFLIEELGRMESAIAVASYREACGQDGYGIPILHEEGELTFEAAKMYHPLLAHPVANSIRLEGCLLLTGSNASGKSTFLKTAALQAILAQTIHTVTAGKYEARFFRIFSSMALRDDIVREESYYMVEIRSLKRILDAMDGKIPVFCCVDEVLRGTNTVERVAASSQILRHMAGRNLICMAATHDIELTYLLEDCYRNCHFEEEVTDQEIRFDYCLKEGRAMTRNAIRLLALMGFDEDIIREAEKMASQYKV